MHNGMYHRHDATTRSTPPPEPLLARLRHLLHLLVVIVVFSKVLLGELQLALPPLEVGKLLGCRLDVLWCAVGCGLVGGRGRVGAARFPKGLLEAVGAWKWDAR